VGGVKVRILQRLVLAPSITSVPAVKNSTTPKPAHTQHTQKNRMGRREEKNKIKRWTTNVCVYREEKEGKEGKKKRKDDYYYPTVG
jgi:hypothetical protein